MTRFMSVSFINNLRKLLLILGLGLLLGLSTANAATSSSTESQRFKLRGILQLGNEIRFSLHDDETGKTFWLNLGARIGELKAQSYDSPKNELLLEASGTIHRLQLATSTDKPLEVMTDNIIKARHESRKSWIDEPVKNPRLANTIRARRAEGFVRSANSAVAKDSTIGIDRPASHSSTSTTTREHFQKSNNDGDPERSETSAMIEQGSDSKANHANPRVLVAREQ